MDSFGLIDPDLAADLMDAQEPAAFANRLLQIAQSVAGTRELFAYRIDASAPDDTPEVLVSLSELADVEERAAAYSRRFHRSDPAARALACAAPGNGFTCRIPAGTIARDEYRKLCFDRPRFAEKICFGWRRPDHALVISFYRDQNAAEPDLARLGALAQLAITSIARQARKPRALLPEIEVRLARAHPNLTTREREVCARTLAGETARGIGERLSLSVGTVLTYRQRAYQKLGCNKSNDLLAAVIA
uniref:helix-turn-helix transcriptional regulator n=1 Tax=Paenirhodobacter enshiensis TaxID=1105367 RepID=UPI0035AEA372